MLTAQDRVEILDLYARYCRLVDARDHCWVDLFTEDGVFEASSTYRGHGELRGFIDGLLAGAADAPAEHTQHWNGAIVLDQVGDEVHGACHLLRVGRVRATGELKVLTLGSCEDRFARAGGAWRFARRTARTI